MRKPLPGHLAFREAVKNKTNKNEKKKNSNLSITVFNAADRNRTGTGITTHGILPSGYEPDELPDCSTPRYYRVLFFFKNQWMEVDSNHRSKLQQIYSLSPLATRESIHVIFP